MSAGNIPSVGSAQDLSRPSSVASTLNDGNATSRQSLGGNVDVTLSGQSLGGYRLCEVIGAGGMGVVYRALDSRLDRSVAIKVMKSDVAGSDAARERFLREARLQSKVECDHVVAVFAADEVNGVPYLVMPLLRGATLATKLSQGRMPLSQVLRVARETALGIAAAHRQDLIHRDIKPSNIWLEESGRAKLMDFGLVRPTADAGAITHSGNLVGTPSYMSPEQITGGRVDKQADLFSLGCVLYEMCTGVRPFAAAQLVDILDNVRFADPTPIRSFDPSAPPELVRLIEWLMEKDPVRRPTDAATVANELAALEVRLAGSSPRDVDFVRAARQSRLARHWLAIGVMIAVVGGAVAWRPWRRLKEAPMAEPSKALPSATIDANAPFVDQPLDPEWTMRLRTSSRDQQRQMLMEELVRRNPRFAGELEFLTWDNASYAKIKTNSCGLSDLTPFAAIPGLVDLECMGQFGAPGDIRSLEAIRGLPLVQAGFSHNPIADLSPLAGMAIQSLWISDIEATDFSPVYGMPLKILHATSRSPSARIDAARLADKPIVDLWLEPEQCVNLERLRSMTQLRLIRNRPAAEFWREFDAAK